MFSFEDFQLRAKAKLLQTAADDWDRSDDDLNDKARLIPQGIAASRAAVLVPLVLRTEPTVLLTRRHAGLAKHAGQIAFPGGRIDVGETAQQAALREAEEEIGLAAKFISPLGYLANYLTVTNYLVTPVVAWVAEGFSLQLQREEVDAAFEVPLAFLMDTKNCQRQSRDWNGIARHFYAYQFQDRHIWGATAGMIRSLHETLYA